MPQPSRRPARAHHPAVVHVRRAPPRRRLVFGCEIAAPRQHVWHLMLDDATFRRWTLPFCDGSHYRGDWTVGRELRFLDPHGNGTLGRVVAHWPAEIVCLRREASLRAHRRVVEPPERDWTGCTEDWLFSGHDGSTRLRVEADVPPAHGDALARAWPRALACLKTLCEGPAGRPRATPRAGRPRVVA